MYYAKFLTHLRFARSRRQSSAGRMDRSKLVRGAVWRRGGRDVGLCARRLLPHTDLAAYRISGCNGRLCVVWLLAALWARPFFGHFGILSARHPSAFRWSTTHADSLFLRAFR